MTINYTTQGSIRGASTYKNRLYQAASKAALDISGEAQGGATVEEWAARQALAHRVLQGGNARMFEVVVLANIGGGPSTASNETEITDGELDVSLAAVWNDVAGIAAT